MIKGYEKDLLFLKDSTDKQWEIVGGNSDVLIDNKLLYSESIKVKESLCREDELQFGSCEASSFEFTIANDGTVPSVSGSKIVVYIYLNGRDNPFNLGTYYVKSDKPTADRNKRQIKAYDGLYDVINRDVKGWMDGYKFGTDGVDLRVFFSDFCAYVGITHEVDMEDEIWDTKVERTAISDTVSGKEVLKWIGEVVGGFWHMSRKDTLQLIILDEISTTLYPSNELYPEPDLYPGASAAQIGEGATYRLCEYEDYFVKKIDKVQIRSEENDIGAVSGEGTNAYIVEDNFICAGKNADELKKISDHLLSVCKKISEYRPVKVEARANPCIEVGDPVMVTTMDGTEIGTYVMSRTISGIQNLMDQFETTGKEERKERVNSVNVQIKRLKGKSNILERTINETISRINDVENGLQTEIRQTSDTIELQIFAIQNQIDGNIKIWESTEFPTLDNYPANQWNTDTDKNAHLGDITYFGEQGYKFKRKEDGTYYWDKLSENDVSKALRDAAEALEIASGTEDLLLKNYSTTAEIASQINMGKGSIGLIVKETLVGRAELTDSKGNLLGDYSTTAQMNSAIKLSADNINLSVSETYETKIASENKYKTLSSSISQTAGEIRLKVSKDDLISEINQSAEMIQITGNRFVVDATNFSLTKEGNLICKNGNFEGTISSKNVNITGGNINIKNSSGTMFTQISSGVLQIHGYADSGGAYQIPMIVEDTIGKKIYISASAITGDEMFIRCKYLLLGNRYPQVVGDGSVLQLSYSSTSSGGVVIESGMFRSAGNCDLDLGHIYHKWNNIYAYSGSIITSDKNEKNSIRDIDDSMYDFIMKMKPSSFKMNNGTSGRTHYGLVAQYVEAVMNEMEIDSKDFAGFIKSKDEDGNDLYGLRYEEFIGPLIKTVQMMDKNIREIRKDVEVWKSQSA